MIGRPVRAGRGSIDLFTRKNSCFTPGSPLRPAGTWRLAGKPRREQVNSIPNYTVCGAADSSKLAPELVKSILHGARGKVGRPLQVNSVVSEWNKLELTPSEPDSSNSATLHPTVNPEPKQEHIFPGIAEQKDVPAERRNCKTTQSVAG
ncbi:hypothetical protein Bbelb_080380 [Branchiostoma belcheri]|nr:hypothetical protein Bbelb_080380 [Branchiostoma belcheri]